MATATSLRRGLYWRLAVGLLVVAGAYGWYVTAKYGRLNELNQRQLAKAAAELESSIQNALETVRRFDPQDDTALCSFDNDQPYLAIVPPEACKWNPGRLLNPVVTSALAITGTASRRPDRGEAGPDGNAVTFEFQTGAMLRELPFPESFGLIFIADEAGQVLYQDAPSTQTWLTRLRWREREYRDSGAGRHESLKLRTLASVFGDDGVSGWPRLRSMSGRTTLPLGGQYHEVYLEPLTIENRDRTVSLLLGGAVPTETIVRRALAIDTYFLVVIVLVLLVALLGFPFVKLVALDARERFRLGDVMWLYTSTAALLAVATLGIQAIDASARWERAADDGLARLGGEVERAFLQEIAAIRRQADIYDEVVSGWPDGGRARPLSTHWYGSPHPDVSVPEPPVQIIQASWVSRETGEQIWKITADATTSRQNVEQRVYFQSVRAGYLFECGDPSLCGVATGPFYIGPERSVTDGKFYTFMAMPSRMTGEQGRHVVAVTSRLFSLSTPALPAGYGFAVINRAGRVLYHADPRLSLREHLFEELGAGDRARALVYAGREAHIASDYRERPHRLHVRPIALRLAGDGSPAGLYVVTFRDVSVETSLAARAFLLTLVVTTITFVVFIGLALAVLARVSAARGRHWSAWLWPHGGVEHVYKRVSVALCVLLATGLVARAAGVSEGWFVAVPILALGTAIGVYSIGTQAVTVRRRLDSPVWHSAMFLLLLVTIVVVPASAVFRAVMGHEFGKLIATEREWMRAQRTDLPAALEAEMRQERRPAAMIERMVGIRARALDGFAAPSPFDAVPDVASRVVLAPFRWADSVLPIESDAAARVRYGGEWSYMPNGSVLSVSAWGLLGLVVAVTGLAWWMRWKAVRLFFADQDTTGPPDGSPALLWDACSRDERLVLIRIVRDHVANPYQRAIVEDLMKRGLLTLDPDLQPCSAAFSAFILSQQGTLQADLDEWEAVDSGHSWRYTRLVLLTSSAGLGLFILATQPGVQASLAGLAGGLAGLLTAGLKLRDSVLAWGDRRAVRS